MDQPPADWSGGLANKSGAGGKRQSGDALAQHLRCDEAEAERLVETMLGRGFLRFNGDPGIAAESGEIWIIRSEDGTEERRDPSQRPKP